MQANGISYGALSRNDTEHNTNRSGTVKRQRTNRHSSQTIYHYGPLIETTEKKIQMTGYAINTTEKKKSFQNPDDISYGPNTINNRKHKRQQKLS